MTSSHDGNLAEALYRICLNMKRISDDVYIHTEGKSGYGIIKDVCGVVPESVTRGTMERVVFRADDILHLAQICKHDCSEFRFGTRSGSNDEFEELFYSDRFKEHTTGFVEGERPICLASSGYSYAVLVYPTSSKIEDSILWFSNDFKNLCKMVYALYAQWEYSLVCWIGVKRVHIVVNKKGPKDLADALCLLPRPDPWGGEE